MFPAASYLYFWLAALSPADLKISTSFAVILSVRDSQFCLYRALLISDILFLLLASQCLDLILVGIEDILLTTPKVRMDLARKKSILGDIGLPGILIEGQQKEPDNANKNANC